MAIDTSGYSLFGYGSDYKSGPTFYVTIIAVVLYSISTLLHLIQVNYYLRRDRQRKRAAKGLASSPAVSADLENSKLAAPGGRQEHEAPSLSMWTLLLTIVPAGLAEVIGWAGRAWGSKNPMNQTAYIMSVICLIIAPSYFSAFQYRILGLCIRNIAEPYCLIPGKLYTRIFWVANFASVILQAVGGGLTSSFATKGKGITGVVHLTVAGLILQLVAMLVFCIIGLDSVVRLLTDRPYSHRSSSFASLDRQSAEHDERAAHEAGGVYLRPDGTTAASRDRWLFMLGLMAFGAVLIFIRGIFRVIELLQGYGGYLFTREIYFNTLDLIPMLLFIWTFNIFHPGRILTTPTRL